MLTKELQSTVETTLITGDLSKLDYMDWFKTIFDDAVKKY